MLLTLLAKNLVRSQVGRAWMAIRDMDVAAEVMGIRPLTTKLLAFAISSFYAGVAGALYAFVFLTSVDITAFDLERSFPAAVHGHYWWSGQHPGVVPGRGVYCLVARAAQQRRHVVRRSRCPPT